MHPARSGVVTTLPIDRKVCQRPCCMQRSKTTASNRGSPTCAGRYRLRHHCCRGDPMQAGRRLREQRRVFAAGLAGASRFAGEPLPCHTPGGAPRAPRPHCTRHVDPSSFPPAWRLQGVRWSKQTRRSARVVRPRPRADTKARPCSHQCEQCCQRPRHDGPHCNVNKCWPPCVSGRPGSRRATLVTACHTRNSFKGPGTGHAPPTCLEDLEGLEGKRTL